MNKKTATSKESFSPPKEQTSQTAGKGQAIAKKYEAPRIEELGRVAVITLKSATGTLTGF